MEDQSLVLKPCVYILELEDECWYVGITLNLNVRLGQHWAGQGSNWTKLHKPLRLVEVLYPGTQMLENDVCQTLILEFGADKVKGGYSCKPNKALPKWFKQ